MRPVNELIKEMTLLEKARLLGGKNVWETVDIPRLNIPSLFLADGPHGVRRQAGAGDHLGLNESLKATCFPTMAALACSFDEEIIEKTGRALGREAKAQGVHLLLGPGLNIKRHPFCGRNFEYASEDSYLSGKTAAAYVRGIQSEQTGACIKHFAANSQELGRMVTDSVVDEKTLRELYMTAFEIAVKEGKPQAVMSSYNRINGVYANEHRWLLTDVLRKEWGFDGIVVSDWGGSNDHCKGAEAGSNIEMPGAGLTSALDIVRAVREGRLSEQAIDDRVSEILHFIEKHVDGDGAAVSEREMSEDEIRAGREAACEAARASIVLLKNEADILPISKETKIALIGEFTLKPRFQGGGSSAVNARSAASLAQSAQKEMKDMTVCRGFSTRANISEKERKRLAGEAVEAAKKAQLVIFCFGLDDGSETEGLDRHTYSLPSVQTDLLKELYAVNPNIVGVLSGGSPVDLSCEKYMKALLHGYLSGEAGAQAMWEILTGACIPSGRLAETYPYQIASVPCHADYPSAGERVVYKEKLNVGYRYFAKHPGLVRYPFGYGLSYTAFDYSDMEVDDTGVSLTVTNTGKRAGGCVPQLYIGMNESAYERPDMELKGFRKIFLKPGESRRVRMEFDEYTFRVYDEKKSRWVVEAGTYDVMIGDNALDIRLSIPVEIGYCESAPHVKMPEGKKGKGEEASEKLHINSSLLSMEHAPCVTARLAGMILRRRLNRMKKTGKPDLNLLFQCYMPIRAIAKMTGGHVSMDMAYGLLDVINGEKGGFRRLIADWRRKRIEEKQAGL